MTEPAPAPTDPPVTPVPNDPLVNEGASESLDPNTPLDSDGAPLDPNTPAEAASDGAPEDPACAAAETASASPDTPSPDSENPCPPKKTGRYAGQPEFVPDSLRRSEVRRVTAALETQRTQHVQNIAEVRGLRLRDKQLGIERAKLSAEVEETLAALEATEEQLRRRALASFVNGDSFELAPSLEHDEILEFQQKQFLVGEVLALDQELLEEYTRLRNRLEEDTLQLFERLNSIRRWLRAAEDEAEKSAEEVGALRFELDTWNYLSATWIPEVVFPIVGDYGDPLINSWGYPRAPGTPDYHWHEGIDIFAPSGTPLVAAEAGEVTDIGYGTLGGLKIWIMGHSGTRWYYAHLDSFNPDLEVGDFVSAGDLIGYIGATGNAVGTPPHLHLQMHPASGRPANPYPILQAASDRFQALKAIGQAPSFETYIDRPDGGFDDVDDSLSARPNAHLGQDNVTNVETDSPVKADGVEFDAASESGADPARVASAVRSP